MKKLYLFVLDFNTGRVHRYNIGKAEDWEEAGKYIEDFIIEKGHILSNCEWMTTENPILEY